MKLTAKKKRGLSAQINLLIVLGVLVAGAVTYFFQCCVFIIGLGRRNNFDPGTELYQKVRGS